MKNKKYSFLEETEFLQRVKELSRENLKFIFSIVKVISISAATIVLLNIIVEKGIPDSSMSFLDFSLRLVLWIASCMALIVSYDGAMLGTLFLVHIPRRTETVATFSLAALEFLLFAILSPNFFLERNEVKLVFGFELINIWFLIFALYCFFANIIIRDALKNINKYDVKKNDGLSKIVKKYKKNLKNQILSSLITGIITLLTFGISYFNFLCKIYLEFFISFLIILSLSFAFNDQHNHRAEIENIVNK